MMIRSLLVAGAFSMALSPVFAEDAMPMDAPRQALQSLPTQSGQAAFAAIHEIVGILEANPKTDWSKVNIDALRAHLIDMENVTLRAKIAYEPLANGEHIHVSGDGEVRNSIQRMVMMHVAMAGDTPNGIWTLRRHRTAYTST